MTLDAFYVSICTNPFAVGINCFGARETRGRISRSWRGWSSRMCCVIPTPDCRTRSVNTISRLTKRGDLLRDFATSGLVDILGGCRDDAGPYQGHVAAAVEGIKDVATRVKPRRWGYGRGVHVFRSETSQSGRRAISR